MPDIDVWVFAPREAAVLGAATRPRLPCAWRSFSAFSGLFNPEESAVGDHCRGVASCPSGRRSRRGIGDRHRQQLAFRGRRPWPPPV